MPNPLSEPRKRGGRRAGAGRPANQPDDNPSEIKLDKHFASNVLKLIGSKIRGEHWTKLTLDTVQSAEEYALLFLNGITGTQQAFLLRLLEWKMGKAVQPVMSADTRETAPELTFGNLPMPAAQPGATGKPN